MAQRSGTGLPDEAVAAGSAAARPDTRRVARRSRRNRLGGTEGNEILTSATAAVLVLLLIAEGVTIIRMRGIVNVHMFIGMLLIPPVLLKLASTGYRFARYYMNARAYREKGPPHIALRVLAPILVVMTVGVFASGVVLLVLGHRSDLVLEIHKVTFIVWGVVFGIHFLAYVPRVVRSLRADWSAARRQETPGAGLRAMLLAAALGGGVGLALALLQTMDAWNGGRFH